MREFCLTGVLEKEGSVIARIPSELLDRIKRELPLERLVERAGVTLKRHGADLLGLCPMHDDHEPSLVVTPGKGLWHCLGACRIGGTAIDWVMKSEGVSFRHAVEILATEFFPLAVPSVFPKRTTVPQLPCPVDLGVEDEELARQVIAYYHDTGKRSTEFLGYCEKRAVTEEAVDRWKLGYANRTLGLRLPAMNRKSGEEIRTRLQRLGFIRESGHELLAGSFVVPVFDETGGVTEVYGRKITPNLRPGTPLHLYLPGPHRGLWNVEALADSKEIILCEALIDALSFWCAGHHNVTSSYGVKGFTPDHFAAFEHYGTERILIAYDRDDAGDRAAVALSERLTARGIDCFRILFPKGMDANDYARKVKPASVSLGVVIRSAEWMGNGRRPARAAAAIAAPPADRIEEPAGEPPPLAAVVPPGAAKERTASEGEASALPARAARQAPAAVHELAAVAADEFVLVLEDRRYRVRGLKKNLSYGVLRLNVLVTREGEMFAAPSPLSGFFVDTFDLYLSRQRAGFEKQASLELGVEERIIRRDLGEVLRKAEELQQEAIVRALEVTSAPVVMSEAEEREALEFLKSPDLPGRILEDFTRCGIVGEETNKLVGYIAAVSRKLERPLAVILQSSSAAGKSLLLEAVLDFLPEEEREKYTAVSSRSLFYFNEETSLKHKVLAIVEEEGAERASYALKLLQSEGELLMASTGKDPKTGRLVTHTYRVEGPVAIFLTTTAVEVDPELLNRCLVLTVDEDREQTRAIHKLQRERETIAGLLAARGKERIVRVHRNAQRLLRPLLVANPLAERLTFLDEKTRTRRDHVKYLTLIRAIALLHQYQRPVRSVAVPAAGGGEPARVEYIEVEAPDVALANCLAAEVLGRSLDELPPQTRRLLGLLARMAAGECERLKVARCDFRFSRRDVRGFTGWADTPLRVHLARLVELEYLLVHHGRRGQSFVYELVYDGQGEDGKAFLVGLIDVERLTPPAPPSSLAAGVGTTESSPGLQTNLAGGKGEFAGSTPAQRRPIAGGSPGRPTPTNHAAGAASGDFLSETPENSLLGGVEEISSSYPRKAVVASSSSGNGSGEPAAARKLS